MIRISGRFVALGTLGAILPWGFCSSISTLIPALVPLVALPVLAILLILVRGFLRLTMNVSSIYHHLPGEFASFALQGSTLAKLPAAGTPPRGVLRRHLYFDLADQMEISRVMCTELPNQK